jgi:hypothetical protein
MIRLSTLIEHFEAPLLAQYGDRLRPEHHQALAALKTCRTALSPRLEAHRPARSGSSCPIPAAIGSVPIASITKASVGWNGRCKHSCPASTSC